MNLECTSTGVHMHICGLLAKDSAESLLPGNSSGHQSSVRVVLLMVDQLITAEQAREQKQN